MQLTFADLIIIGVIGISFLFGAWRGLVKEALSLACWIAAAVLATLYNAALAPRLDWISDNPAVRRVAAAALIFVGTVFAGGIVSNLVSRLASAAGLKAADRGLGAVFGLVRGIVVVTLVIVFTADFEPLQSHYSNARTVPYLMVLADSFQSLLGAGSDIELRGN